MIYSQPTQKLLDLRFHLGAHMSMGPDGIHPRALKRLANVIAGPLSVTLQYSWQSLEISVHWKLANVPVFKRGKKEDPGNYKSVSLSSVSGKIMEKVILRLTEKHLRDNAVIGYSQHGLIRGKPYLTNLISFYDKVIHLNSQGKPVDVGFLCCCRLFLFVSSFFFFFCVFVYVFLLFFVWGFLVFCSFFLNFSKAFATVSHSILLDKTSSIQLENLQSHLIFSHRPTKEE